MHSIYILFKYIYFILLRSLQDISQLYIKYTENALLIHNNDNNNDNVIVVIIIIIISDNDNFKNKEKV